jgi:hypothetical protein
VVGALKDDQHQVAGLPVERLESPDRLERQLKGRVTMLHDETTRSKLAARQPNSAIRIVSLPICCRGRISNPVLIAATAVIGLIA